MQLNLGPIRWLNPGAIMAFISANRKELFFIFLVFLLAFGIRGHQFVYEYFFEFDGYYHARMTEYVLQHNEIPKTDPLAYYQLPGGAPNPQFQDGPFWWLFTSTLFRVVTLGAPYSREAFFFAIKLFPALFGSLVAVAMYFLGKEMYSRRAGAVMAIFAAVVPAFVYRTMAGWFEGQSLGFLWLVLGFIFLVRSVKSSALDKSTMLNAGVAGFFFAVMSWNWQAYLMAPYIIIGFAIIVLGVAALRFVFVAEDPAPKLKVVANIALAFVVFLALSSLVIGEHFFPSAISNIGNLFGEGGQLNLGGAGQTAGSVFSISVGEESKGLVYWGNKYNAMAAFIGWPLAEGNFPWYIPGLVFIFLFYRIFTKKDDNVSLLALAWIGFAIFLAYIKLKFTFYLGLPVALAAGITINEALSLIGDRPGFEKKAIAVAAGFMLLTGVAAGSYFISQNTPNIEYDTGWKEALLWIDKELPKDAKLFNWWDEGHWLAFLGRRAIITDNRNMDLETNSDYAKLVLAESEESALAIINSRYNSDYLVVSEDLINKLGSMGIYAYKTTDSSDPRISKYLSALSSCELVKNELAKTSVVRCSQLRMSNGQPFEIAEEQFNSLPYQRIKDPNLTMNGQRVFFYRSETGTKVYILNKPANDSFIAKLFFERSSLKNFEQVYSFKEVKIFKIKK